MTKIDKTDLENIKLIVKESKINGVAKIKIKKNDYEIEITSNDFSENNVSVQKFEKNTEIKEVDNEKNVSYAEISSEGGHDAFLMSNKDYFHIMKAFIDEANNGI